MQAYCQLLALHSSLLPGVGAGPSFLAYLLYSSLLLFRRRDRV